MPYVDASGLSLAIPAAFARGQLLVLSSGISGAVGVPEGAGALIHAGNGISACLAAPLGHLIKPGAIALAEATSSTRVRVTFDRPMLNDGKLRNVANYLALSKFPTGAAVVVLNVTPQGIPKPTYVDLAVTEMTDGETYIAFVMPTTGPTDSEGTPIGPTTNTYEFIGVGIIPVVNSATSTGVNGVEIEFSERMKDNLTIRDPARYAFDAGLVVLGVLGVSGKIVTLATSDQVPGLLYTLTITQP